MPGMTSTKLSISLPEDLLKRADLVLSRPGEGRSALIARVLSQAIREAEDAEIDAAYERAFARRPAASADLERSNALARAAIRSTRSGGARRGPTV